MQVHLKNVPVRQSLEHNDPSLVFVFPTQTGVEYIRENVLDFFIHKEEKIFISSFV